VGSTVKVLENFNIDIYNLSNDKHDYQFQIGNSFFESFPEQIIDKGQGVVNVELVKSETLIDITFDIAITVELECDRTLEPFDYQIDLTQGLIYKYGEEEKELDDEIIIITRNQQRINLAQHIFEYIGLAIPMKKLHPKFEGEDESDELIYTSKEEEKKEEDDNEAVDPRWQALRKLK